MWVVFAGWSMRLCPRGAIIIDHSMSGALSGFKLRGYPVTCCVYFLLDSWDAHDVVIGILCRTSPG